jgi:hypothetical protein
MDKDKTYQQKLQWVQGRPRLPVAPASIQRFQCQPDKPIIRGSPGPGRDTLYIGAHQGDCGSVPEVHRSSVHRLPMNERYQAASKANGESESFVAIEGR